MNSLLHVADHCPRNWDRVVYKRAHHANIHVRGYEEESTMTSFDMAVRNRLDRFHLAADVIYRVPRPGAVDAGLLHFLGAKT